jgi:hypothetical protein
VQIAIQLAGERLTDMAETYRTENLTRAAAQRLEQLATIRNSLVHAGDAPVPTVEDVVMLQRVTEDVLRSAQ